jgi:serine/threonine protein phosphatase 1
MLHPTLPGRNLQSSVMPNTFVIGDIHGAHTALKQCLKRANFDYENDTLISLGDVCDGWPETRECIDELLAIKNLIYILGNHDLWTLEWMKTGQADSLWIQQGGKATVDSYQKGIPQPHLHFLEKAHLYFINDNKLFVHAGIIPTQSIKQQNEDTFLWDRTLAHTVLDFYNRGIYEKMTVYDEVYLGHTPVSLLKPINACDVWLMDTGAGWSGVLSMMEINSKETFISDPTPDLYPGIQGRRKRNAA